MRIDINSADRQMLETVSGIGPKTSAIIIERRLFRPWTLENIGELARPGWPNKPFSEIFLFGSPAIYPTGNNYGHYQDFQGEGMRDSEPLEDQFSTDSYQTPLPRESSTEVGVF